MLGIARTAPSDREALWLMKAAAGSYRFEHADICDMEAVSAISRSFYPQTVIHAAAVTPLEEDDERHQYVEAMRINTMGTVSVLESARASSARLLVYVSSAAVYGRRRSRRQVTERDPARPQGVYDISKYAGERLALRYGELFELETRSVRIKTPYGPWERPRPSRPQPSLIYRWCEAALSGTPVTELHDLARDFTFVEDTARGILAVAMAERTKSRLYNISAGTSYRYSDALKAIAQVIPQFSFRIGSNGESAAAPSSFPVLATERARRELDWYPLVSLEDGIRRYLEWLIEPAKAPRQADQSP